jgi:hypothetical protein
MGIESKRASIHQDRSATINMAMDVSFSIRVSDVKPTWMVAAQESAKLFMHDLKLTLCHGHLIVATEGVRSV